MDTPTIAGPFMTHSCSLCTSVASAGVLEMSVAARHTASHDSLDSNRSPTTAPGARRTLGAGAVTAGTTAAAAAAAAASIAATSRRATAGMCRIWQRGDGDDAGGWVEIGEDTTRRTVHTGQKSSQHKRWQQLRRVTRSDISKLGVHRLRGRRSGSCPPGERHTHPR
jgi:hypothetical protein